MKALVYNGAGRIAVEDRPEPTIQTPSDAIIKLTSTTICGTDLHIIKGDVPTVKPGRVLGHEGIGIVHSVGTNVKEFKAGDHVLIACITSCLTCTFCRKGTACFCKTGGWRLGHLIDGTQAEFVRIPHAEGSLHHIPQGINQRSLLVLSDILPTGLEVGVLRGGVKPGCSVAIVGAGPVGLAALLTAQLYSPSTIVMIDRDEKRLEIAKKMGATHTLNPDVEGRSIKELTREHHGEIDGFDIVIEAVGVPATFETCQQLVGLGGAIANVGVHGRKVDLHLEDLWSRGIRKSRPLRPLFVMSGLNHIHDRDHDGTGQRIYDTNAAEAFRGWEAAEWRDGNAW
jgi:alcohol dehydrogenase